MYQFIVVWLKNTYCKMFDVSLYFPVQFNGHLRFFIYLELTSRFLVRETIVFSGVFTHKNSTKTCTVKFTSSIPVHSRPRTCNFNMKKYFSAFDFTSC